jgi:hypothetical protein
MLSVGMGHAICGVRETHDRSEYFEEKPKARGL